MSHRTWSIATLWASVAAQLFLADAHHNIIPSSSLPPVPARRYAIQQAANFETLISNIRGGGFDTGSKTLSAHKPTKKRSSTKSQKVEQSGSKNRTENARGNVNNDGSRIMVRSILIPRQTSFLTPLRFLSFLLMNISFNSCLQTAGKPLVDAVRRVLDMPSPGIDNFGSKVTPLHLYVAKKIVSASSSLSTPSEMLPPGHLPSPLPLLGFFCSILLYVGGTVLLPRWNVEVDVLLNYEQFDIHGDETKCINNAGYALQNWFDRINEDEMDPYFASSSKKRLAPAVLVNEMEMPGQSEQAINEKTSICPLFYSPGYDGSGEAQHESEESEEQQHLKHPRRYYFELDQRRYYYDPMHATNDNSQSSDIVSGGPSLHKKAPQALLSDFYTRGLHTNAQLTYAKERYSPYSDISIPVPTLRSAFFTRVSSPLVSLQLTGRLLTLVEEESIGRALANLARLGIQHFVDAKRSIASAITLAEEVKGIDKNEDDAIGNRSRFWALRPTDTTTTKKGNADRANADWVQVSPNQLLPGDVFVIAPLTNRESNKDHPSGSTSHASPSLTIPVDALLLDGTCVTEEAALTGESVPQAKVPLDFSVDEIREYDDDSSPHLDMSGIHRSSCVFAGTGLLHSSNCDEDTASSSSVMFDLPPLPRETFANNETLPAIFLTLRTGSYSTRGKIIQSLLKTRINMGVSNRENEVDSIRLIGVLALFAVGACLFLILDNSDSRQKDSVFKQIVQCTRIAVASVPSDLPASLSSCEHECAKILKQESEAVNSETGALLKSARIDTIVFDKTGTLTADTQALISIAYPPHKPSVIKDSPQFLSNIVLAGGHTLVGMGEDETNLAGDPVDLAGLCHTHWKYNAREKKATSCNNNSKLWQIRSFPFDPVKKMSSALVLVQNNAGVFQLWVVAKGSPNKIRDLVLFENNEKDGLTCWYDEKVKRLGKLGYRSIGLGALDVTDTKAADTLFPSGLPNPNDNSLTLETRIHEARRHARKSFVRRDIEILNMMFVGFALFNAPMRGSSPRVVNELNSCVKVIMLTGDETYASSAIAKKAGITNGKKICILKTEDSELVWENNNKVRRFTLERAKKVQRDIANKRTLLVVTGDAVSALLSATAIDKTAQYVQKELLSQTSLIASASPSDKSLFVKWLRSCKRNVLMCGDGVNDIAAMREATVSVAMLSGFGHEAEGTRNVDTDNLRRKERLKRRYIGSNRLKVIKSKPSTLDEAGVGDSFAASSARVHHSITEGTRQLRSENKGTSHHTTALDICLASIKGEMKRHKDLKKGGSNAAKILAEEDRLRSSLEGKATPGNLAVEVHGIQTGESCLASSFTLLRPCIGGVESILRTGVSAAACSISFYRKVALNCMLSCYNLSSLYKNGLRYGKCMWQVELASIAYIDGASFTASSTPRPRLVAGVRPATTPFHASEVLSTTLQAIIHMVTLTYAVSAGRNLEVKYPTQSAHKGFGIKWGKSSKTESSVGSLLATLVGSSSATSLHSDGDAPPPQSFLRRPPFQPNYISNNVFIMSVFQNAVMAMVNHSGRPFSATFLESRPLCLSVNLAFLLCIVCISESIPMLNRFIQLAPYPTKASRIVILRLLLLNLSMSYFAEYFSTFFLRHDIWKERNKPFHSKSYHHTDQSLLSAAEEEEKLLSEERHQNSMIVSFICFLILNFSIQILKPPVKV